MRKNVDTAWIDSRKRHVKFLLKEIEIGFAFVRSASILTDPELRARTLLFAQHAYDTIIRSLGNTPLTQGERVRLNRGLHNLLGAITTCGGAVAE